MMSGTIGKMLNIEDVVLAYQEWQKHGEDLTGAKQLFNEAANDPEMKEMARAEIKELEDKMEEKSGLLVSRLCRVCLCGVFVVFLVILSMFVWSVVFHLGIKNS